MSVPNYRRFVSECFIQNFERQTALREDEIYGLYISWCLLNNEKTGPSASLWAAMEELGHRKQQDSTGSTEWPGLNITGPAAVEYILASQPSLLYGPNPA